MIMEKIKILKATHEGTLKLGETLLDVAVLEDQTRVVTQAAVFKALDRPVRGTTRVINLPTFMDAKNLKPFISEDLMGVINKIKYEDTEGRTQEGYNAKIIPLVSDLYLRAREEKVLHASQVITAKKSEILVRSLAQLGITALVDEATGYQDVRVKDALQQIFDKLLLEEAKKYQVTFPLELYKQWFRLNGWQWKPENAQKRPGVIGKWTNKYIYDRMAPGLLKELERRNPKNDKGYREHKHFSFLTDEIGEPKLREFFGGLIALAKASTSWKKYINLVERAYPAHGDQLTMFADEE